MEQTITLCADCGLPAGEHYVEISESIVCENCSTFYEQCYGCDEMFPSSDMNTDGHSNRYCSECWGEMDMIVCDWCGDWNPQAETYSDRHGTTLCESCYNDSHECDECGRYMSPDDAESDDDGVYFCSNCRQDAIGIFNYSYRPMFNLTKCDDEPEPNGFYGLELEVDSGRYENRKKASKALKQLGRDDFYLKHDGSLNCGFEIVTQPMSLKYHLEQFPWHEVSDACISARMRSHNTHTCGLHVHVSRTMFGKTQTTQDLNIAKLMLLFDKWWDEKIVPFTRRDTDEINQWAKKPDAEITEIDDETIASEKVARCRRRGRYQAINLQNNETVELRVFRGTLNVNTIKATLQWTDMLIKYCKNTQLKQLWSADWDAIFADCPKELATYLEQRKLSPDIDDDSTEESEG